MANLSGFDATQVAPSTSMEALPKGDYLMMITDTEMKPIKSGKGEGLNITFEVLDGDHKGKKAWVWLNLVHENAQAVEISQRNLSAICHAVGVLKPSDSIELHDRPLIVTMAKDRNDPERTVPQSYKPANSAAVPMSVTARVPVQARPAVAAQPPWKRQAA